jgi:predicted aspartyl protease
MRSWRRLPFVLIGACFLLSSPGWGQGQPQSQPQSGPTLGEAARELWRRVPDSVKAKAREKLVEIIEKSFGGVRRPPPPPPPPRTKKEKAAAERARKAELAKLKKLERQRKAAAEKARREALRKQKAAEKAAAAAVKAGKTPPKVAPVVVPPPIPEEPLRELAVPLERRGSSYYVAARLNGRVDVNYLYDTGASLTTVDRATLQKLGVQIPENAATIRTSTANGVVEVPLVVLDSIDVGGARVTGGFTVSLCEPCSDGRKSGLLGLNFSRRYLVTLDEGAKQLRLVPRVEMLDHRFDVEPFLKYQEVRGSMRGGVFSVAGTVLNRAPRAAHGVKVVAILVDAQEKEVGRVPGVIGTIPAGGTAPIKFQGRARTFSKFYLELDGASW